MHFGGIDCMRLGEAIKLSLQVKLMTSFRQ